MDNKEDGIVEKVRQINSRERENRIRRVSPLLSQRYPSDGLLISHRTMHQQQEHHPLILTLAVDGDSLREWGN